MKMDHILVRYGELALKGKNRGHFEKLLLANIRHVLKPFPKVQAKRTFGRIVVELNSTDHEPVAAALANVFGIQSYSLALRVENELEAMQKGALFMLTQHPDAKTFKVSARRAYKLFPIDSQSLNHKIGSYVLKAFTGELTVDVHHPDVNVVVDVRESGTYITAGVYAGAKGLPVGSSGKVLHLLSGGIDSPVAAHMLMGRGAEVEMLHFHSPPYTNERAKQKVIDLTRELTKFGRTITIHFVPFTDIQTHIHKEVPSSYEMTIMRRMMLRIADRIARERGILAISNGESLGQVASQTLASMNTINEMTNLPVLRPLLAMDKETTIAYAKRIGTYETSILPYEDCCTIFLPTDSKTKPKRDRSAQFEQYVQVEEKCREAIAGIESLEVTGAHTSPTLDQLF
ncbi:putative tRNA sulfurtransferase [Shouchella clausii]|uniref:tRNA uracil 4-sulfurtransferase ThiI n=1 Tax=Shouchella TaxID=2893057 RepID=UPI000BA735A4|nr:tRNA uracil 4-sulfurtransferase ThiI [Shouchella clausii]PAE93531.1 tRNA 4-thiouridine(8) synthase ThiI [Shouchella clausii]GIN06703.1 putative tRNA sulfurtransferase [Shouchella clausii]